jgi:hypothetical protein
VLLAAVFGSTLGVTGAATFSSTVAGAFNGTLGATTPASVAATTGTFSGVVTANAGVVVDNITIDGSDINLGIWLLTFLDSLMPLEMILFLKLVGQISAYFL